MSFYKLPACHKEVMSIVTSDFWLTEPHMPFRSWFVLNLFRFHDTSCPSIPCGWVAFILIIFYHSSLLYSLLLIVLLSSLSQVNLLNHGPHRFKFWHAWIDLSLTSNTNLVAYYNIWTIFFIDLGLVGIIFRLASNTNLVTIILLSEGAIYLSQFDYTLRASTSNITLAASSQWRTAILSLRILFPKNGNHSVTYETPINYHLPIKLDTKSVSNFWPTCLLPCCKGSPLYHNFFTLISFLLYDIFFSRHYVELFEFGNMRQGFPSHALPFSYMERGVKILLPYQHHNMAFKKDSKNSKKLDIRQR